MIRVIFQELQIVCTPRTLVLHIKVFPWRPYSSQVKKCFLEAVLLEFLLSLGAPL